MQTLDAPASIMIKAIAGGGGRGMRTVQDSSELDEAVTQARREARAAFGDDPHLRRALSRWRPPC